MNPEEGSASQFLEQLLKRPNAASMSELIELNLTRLDEKFFEQLRTRLASNRKADVKFRSRMRKARDLSREALEGGNYRKAIFDEAKPGNAKEILLSQARSVERGERSLAEAVRMTLEELETSGAGGVYLCCSDFTLSIERNPEMADFVALGELVYETGRRFLQGLGLDLWIAAHNANATSARNFILRGQYEEAMRCFERLVSIAEENQKDDLLCRALLSLGDLWRDRMSPEDHPDSLERAARYHVEALRCCEKPAARPDLRVDALFQLSKTRLESKQYLEATQCLRELLAQIQASAAGVSYNTLEVMAAMLSHLTHRIGDEAADAVHGAVQLAESMAGDRAAHKFRSTVYATLGIYYKQAGNPQASLDAYEIAVAEAEAIGDESAAARWLSNKRQIYVLLEQWEEAAAIAKRTGLVFLAREDYQGAANQLLDEGHLASLEGDFAQAADLWGMAYALFHREHRPNEMGYAILNLSRVYKAFGNPVKAEACLDRCLTIARTEGAERLECYALGELAALQTATSGPERAVETYEQAIEMAEKLGEMIEQDLRIGRGRALEKINRTREAADDYYRAIELQEAARSGFRDHTRRIQAQRRPEQAMTLLLSLLARRADDSRAVYDAFVMAERARSRTLAELLSRGRLRRPLALPPELVIEEQELLGRLSTLEESDPSGPEATRLYAQYKAELNEVWRQIAEIDEECRDYADLRRATVATPDDIARLLII